MAVAGVKVVTSESWSLFLLSMASFVSLRSKDGVVSKVGIGDSGAIVLVYGRACVVL